LGLKGYVDVDVELGTRNNRLIMEDMMLHIYRQG